MKRTLLYLIVVFCIGSGNSQIKGHVFDLNNKPLQDIVVLNKQTNEHTHSDANGYFKCLKNNPGDTLQFSFLGYKSVVHWIVESDFKINLKIQMEESSLLLDQVNITEPLHYNLQKIDMILQPVQNSQEMLRLVPGLFIAQHAGGGKAEQLFLRGFDIDHGTDIGITVDHLIPVNMVSHAHGQGYADLHFVIPESVRSIDFEKGSYNASKGNFATAGSVDFQLKERIANNSVIFETGKFQSHRLVGLIKLLENEKSNAYIASEYVSTDGYFEAPQDFKKFNTLLKYNSQLNENSKIKLTGSYFTSSWNASGQIPVRAVESGFIGRFGAIDPNEGGETNRFNFMAQYLLSTKPHQALKLSAYFSNYNFELYSNFTFFHNDSVNGDQIKQKEQRNIYGFEANYTDHLGNIEFNTALGSRIDETKDSELSHTKDRSQVLNRLALGDLNEHNLYLYLKLNWLFNKLEFQVQGRADLFKVSYSDKLLNPNSKSSDWDFKISPKLNVYYNLNNSMQLFVKSGLGFHSNDTRLLRESQEKGILTRSFNVDLGTQIKLGNSALLHGALWLIKMEDELVYVGDEAVVESSGKTVRKGIEAGIRWQPISWFSLNFETSCTIAKSADEPETLNYIPLASKWTTMGSLNFKNIRNFSASLRYRQLGDRPANEDYSITAKGYQLLDGNINYKYKNINFGFVVENIFNTKWNEAQFATLSRLKTETESTEEIHFTPGTPIHYRFKIQIDF